MYTRRLVGKSKEISLRGVGWLLPMVDKLFVVGGNKFSYYSVLGRTEIRQLYRRSLQTRELLCTRWGQIKIMLTFGISLSV
jgi:hypothetical protein